MVIHLLFLQEAYACWQFKISKFLDSKNLQHAHRLLNNFKFKWLIDFNRLEDLKVLRRSPDLLNNVKKVEGQLHLIMEQILFYHIWDLQPFWSSDLNNLMNNPSNSPVISEKKMFR